jgi:hypothetical protein
MLRLLHLCLTPLPWLLSQPPACLLPLNYACAFLLSCY